MLRRSDIGVYKIAPQEAEGDVLGFRASEGEAVATVLLRFSLLISASVVDLTFASEPAAR